MKENERPSEPNRVPFSYANNRLIKHGKNGNEFFGLYFFEDGFHFGRYVVPGRCSLYSFSKDSKGEIKFYSEGGTFTLSKAIAQLEKDLQVVYIAPMIAESLERLSVREGDYCIGFLEELCGKTKVTRFLRKTLQKIKEKRLSIKP